jgi:ppGpp synthetase/RelA/SpoT-type nucleotidyltranferase
VTEQELIAAYEKQTPALIAWGNVVTDTILARLAVTLGKEKMVSEFLKIPPKPRVKEIDSFLAKALRRNKNYDRPLEQITDMVGVRFVVLLLTELRMIADIIENCEIWEAEKARDFEAEKIERPHYFDYQSIHYIVHPRKPLKCGSVNIPATMNCEIQVRTLLQHAYAELAHNTTYKPSLCLDRDVNRQIAKSSALVEATDEIFVGVHNKIISAGSELKRVHDITKLAYQKHVGELTNADERLTSALLDPYRQKLSVLTSESLDAFLLEKDFIAEHINERAPLSVFYRHPVILAVYFLVNNEPDMIPKCWPTDLKQLEMIYCDLGISSEGRLW